MATIGDTGARSTNTIYYDALLTTTLNAYRKELVDNIFKESALLAFLRKNGGVIKQDGGERVAIPLMYGDNSTIKTHGGYEVLDTTPQEGLTTAFFPWAEIGGTVSISRLEKRQNSGEGRLINLLEAKVKQAEYTMTEKLNGDLVQGSVSSATFIEDTSVGGTKGLIPIPMMIRKANATDPTSGNVGNIAASSYSWWRTRSAVLDSGSKDTGNDFALSVSTYAGLKVALHRMYNYCGRGSGGSPNLVLGDQVAYETYNNALDTQMRYADTDMANMGFTNVRLMGATFIWDEKVPDMDEGEAMADASTPASSIFFINTKFMKLCIDSETDVVTTPFVEPENQTASTSKILFMGQLTTSNQRKHGVCYAGSQSIVA